MSITPKLIKLAVTCERGDTPKLQEKNELVAILTDLQAKMIDAASSTVGDGSHVRISLADLHRRLAALDGSSEESDD